MKGHTYFVKELDKEVPSVTTILNIIAKGEGFNNWLKKQGDKADTLLQEAGDFGSNIHNHLETIGKGIPINLKALKPRELRCVKTFLGWKEEFVDSFLKTEMEIYSIKEEFAGTMDALVKLKDGRIFLLDYKTSKYLYDTNHLQVVAYLKAYEEIYPLKIDGAYILRFEKDDKKEQDMEIKEVENIDYQYEVFLCALKLWNWKERKKNGSN